MNITFDNLDYTKLQIDKLTSENFIIKTLCYMCFLSWMTL